MRLDSQGMWYNNRGQVTSLTGVVFAVMVAQDVGVCGGEGLNLSKGNGRENECCEENYGVKGAHGAQYGA